MRTLSPYACMLTALTSLYLTACGEDDKPVDTATVNTEDTDIDTDDTVDTGETADTSENTDDTADTNDTGAVDSGDTADTGTVDTGDTDTDTFDTGTSEAGPNAVPDFVLADINPNSSTMGQNISPRDYLQQISGWYFIKAT